MIDGTEPEPTIESLLQANQELRTKLDELKEQIEAERKAVRRVGWFGLKVFSGGDLRRSFRAWMNAKSAQDPMPNDETADLAAALVQRLVRVSLAGLAVAVLPTALLVWQNWEIRKQSGLFRDQIQAQSNQHARTELQQDRQLDQQERAALIARRAQLLATIYDCAQSEHREEADDEPEICPPKAHPRARVEAVRVLAEIDGVGLDLSGADLSALILTGADLREVNLRGANLRGADLREADLRWTDLSRAGLSRASLFRADLGGAHLREASLFEADLRGANLSEADLFMVDLAGTDLFGANLRGANLRGANLMGAILYGADLSGADLFVADLSRAHLNRADLSGADLSGAHLREAQIDSANGNAETQLPEGLTHPDHWLEPEQEQDPPSDISPPGVRSDGTSLDPGPERDQGPEPR